MLKQIQTERIKGSAKIAYDFTKNHSFISFVIAPVIVCAIYFVIIATPRYESATILSLSQNQNNPISTESYSSLFSGVNSEITSKSRMIIDYIRSQGMLVNLQKSMDLKGEFQKTNVDFISRLSKGATVDDFLNYYNSMMEINYDEAANAITIKVQGYSSLGTNTMLEHIVHFAQVKVDQISRKLADNRMKFISKELTSIKIKAIESQQKLVEFQSDTGMVSPDGSLNSKSTLIGQLRTDLANSEAKLTSLKSYLNDSSAQVVAEEQRVNSLKQQIEKEKRDFLQSKEDTGKSELSNIIDDYQWLKLENEFAMREYASTLDSYEEAQIDSARQQSYLVAIMNPTLADAPTYPKSIYNLILIFIILSVIYGILRMIITIISEHR